MNKKLENFFYTVKSLFNKLSYLGFVIPENGIEESPTYGRIAFHGRNVCIVFSYDLLEGKSECYVGKIDNGEISANRDEGGYWSSLYSYLLHKGKYRGKLPINDEWQGKEFPELLAFELLLTERAKEILTDSKDAFY